MIHKIDEEIYLLAKAFEERTLPKAAWKNAAHLTVVFYHCFHNRLGTAKI